MNMKRLIAMTKRVLLQLGHDPRTVALMFLSPPFLLTILKYVYWSNPALFQQVAGSMLGVFPMLVMFLITSVATLRERTSGTLERLMISPLAKVEFIGGYAIAFGLANRRLCDCFWFSKPGAGGSRFVLCHLGSWCEDCWFSNCSDLRSTFGCPDWACDRFSCEHLCEHGISGYPIYAGDTSSADIVERIACASSRHATPSQRSIEFSAAFIWSGCD